MGRADDGADAREAAVADELLAELADEQRDLLPERAAVGERQVLDVDAAGVRGLDEAEEPAAAAAAGGDERLERVAAEVRVHGQRVGDRLAALARLEVRVGVRARGRADVAALAVDDHEQPGRARVADDPLEGGDSVGAEHLEERELRLDGDAVRRDRVDDPAAEARGRLGGGRPADVRVAAELEREQVEPRVEPDDQLAAAARRPPRRARSAKVVVATAAPSITRRVDSPRAAPRRTAARSILGGTRAVLAAADGRFSELPAVNFGTVAAGMCTFSPGFRGFTPIRALRSDVANLPKPVKLI